MFAWIDGKVIFAKYKVNDTLCFTDEEKNKLVSQLKNPEIAVLEHDAELADRCKGKTFENYSQAKAYIDGESVEILKQELAETDYQIIKYYEYELVGIELPYDIETLHLDRQHIRDKINQLEGE